MFFCHISHSPIRSRAITLQFETVEKLQKQSRLTRSALAKKDADTILKALRNINSLCDVFQVSFSNYRQKLRADLITFLKVDTQLNIEVTVGEILEVLYSRYLK